MLRRRFRLAPAALACLALVAPPPGGAQQAREQVPQMQPVQVQPRVDLGAFVKDLMIMQVDGDQMELALWFPHEFFLAAAQAQGVARADAERELAMLKPYTVVFVQSQLDRPDGSSAYLTEKEVYARAVLRTPDGEELRPMQQPPPRVAALVSFMKTLVAADGGKDAANLHILVFPASNKLGKPVVNTSQRDSLTMVMKADQRFKERTFVWRTPFDAVTSAPPCPRCKAAMSAKWAYCPYDGAKLTQ